MQNPIRTRSVRSLVVTVLGALLLATVAGMALTHAAVPELGAWHPGGMWGDGHMTDRGAWGPWTVLLGTLWTALLFGLPAYLVYRLATRSRTSDRRDAALDILRQQYARGEIDDEEFERRRARLTSNR